jgi:hypothetical protein
VVCWGSDSYGQATPPDAVNGVLGTATAIAAGGEHSCAIQAGTGDVICWGKNFGGERLCVIQPGTGDVICWGEIFDGQATPPDAVNGVSGTATDIAASGFYGCEPGQNGTRECSGGHHSCAIQAGTGNVVCWGDDSYGQATPPDSVNGISGTATAIAADGDHSCAIQAGTDDVVCWGWDYGARGDYYGQATPPDAVNGVSGAATDIAAGGIHTLAIALPEPSVLTAVESGIVMLALLYRRRRRSAEW